MVSSTRVRQVPQMYYGVSAPFNLWTGSLSITQPSATSLWQVGSVQTIQFSVIGFTGGSSPLANIYYQSTSSVTWTSIVLGAAASSGSYSWTVPALPGGPYQI